MCAELWEFVSFAHPMTESEDCLQVSPFWMIYAWKFTSLAIHVIRQHLVVISNNKVLYRANLIFGRFHDKCLHVDMQCKMLGRSEQLKRMVEEVLPISMHGLACKKSLKSIHQKPTMYKKS